jgi:hypothetical protein
MKNTLTRLLFIAFFILILFRADGYSQFKQPRQKEKVDFVSRLRFGGWLGLQFGTITSINVSPMVIYQANNWLYPGIGFSYMYYNDKRYIPEYSNSTYGMRVFSSFYIWQDLFAHAEFETLNIEYYDQPGERGFINNIMLGGGYRQWIGNRAFAMFTILYNFNDTRYSPYRNPIIRIGFGAGI